MGVHAGANWPKLGGFIGSVRRYIPELNQPKVAFYIMERKASLEQSIRFAEFEVDPRAGELRKLGVKIKLQEQPFQVLAMLLEHPGEVVTREELQQRIWPADTLVDFENGLNKAINKLREALGDSAENPRFVETLPRHGYRFIASIDRVVEQQRGHLARGGHVGVPPQSRRWLAAVGGQ